MLVVTLVMIVLAVMIVLVVLIMLVVMTVLTVMAVLEVMTVLAVLIVSAVMTVVMIVLVVVMTMKSITISLSVLAYLYIYPLSVPPHLTSPLPASPLSIPLSPAPLICWPGFHTAAHRREPGEPAPHRVPHLGGLLHICPGQGTVW